jgi:hypothetical protein
MHLRNLIKLTAILAPAAALLACGGGGGTGGGGTGGTKATSSSSHATSTSTSTSSSSSGTVTNACTDSADQMVITSPNSTLTADTHSCELNNIGNMSAVSMCLQTMDKLSKPCADCFAAYADCGAMNCLTPCLANASSPACQSCIQSMCGPAFVSCSGLTNITPPSDGGTDSGGDSGDGGDGG